MHEGASGGGKSEMLEKLIANRRPIVAWRNIVTGERRYLEIPRTCSLQAVTDDWLYAIPSLQEAKANSHSRMRERLVRSCQSHRALRDRCPP